MLNTDFLDPTYVLDLNTCLLSLEEYAAKVDLVESAFASMDYYKTDLEKLCSVYRSLIKDHAFFDANKRTASLYLKSGLESLGYDVDQDQLADLTLEVATHQYEVNEVANKLRSIIRVR